jgi:hypothetical protein
VQLTDPQIELSFPGRALTCSYVVRVVLLVESRLLRIPSALHVCALEGLLLPLSKALDTSLPTLPLEQRWLQAQPQQRAAAPASLPTNAMNSLHNDSQADPVSQRHVGGPNHIQISLCVV